MQGTAPALLGPPRGEGADRSGILEHQAAAETTEEPEEAATPEEMPPGFTTPTAAGARLRQQPRRRQGRFFQGPVAGPGLHQTRGLVVYFWGRLLGCCFNAGVGKNELEEQEREEDGGRS